MSGTSMDAADAALVDVSEKSTTLVAKHRMPWPTELRNRLQAIATGAPIAAEAFAQLDREAGEFFALLVNRLLLSRSVDPAQVRAIGCHGQTVAHVPEAKFPSTLQVGDGNVIAEQTGITTVTDFRRRDMAAGGQGAPLAPSFHEATVRHPDEDRIVLNLGGIANITVLPADAGKPVIGFDTGPANCLMDLWIGLQRGVPFDASGNWAASAEPDLGLLEQLLDDPYFALPPPKSTGTQHFSANWLDTRLASTAGLEPAVIQATLLELTCRTVTDAIAREAPTTMRVLVCGGGVLNQRLMHQLGSRLEYPVESISGYGLDPEWLEPMAFAWLARRAVHGNTGNLPSVTGATGTRVLGAIHPA